MLSYAERHETLGSACAPLMAAGDWVIVRWGSHRNALARVREVREGDDMVTVALIPEIPAEIGIERPRGLFTWEMAIGAFADDPTLKLLSEEKPNADFVWRGKTYRKGLLHQENFSGLGLARAG